ncbi:MFS transporter [Acinetobacter sp. 1207_04]
MQASAQSSSNIEKTQETIHGTSQDKAQNMVVSIICAVAFAHLLNDLIQASLPAIYPLLKDNFLLSFSQIGLISLVYQITASLLQPWIGLYTDKHPKPYLLPLGMIVTLIGIGVLAIAPSFTILLVAAALIGIGSSTFHPEASRVARFASSGRFGTAQSAFQVGGNSGSAIGPLLAAIIIVPYGQMAIAWFMIFAFIAVCVLFKVSQWTVKYAHKIVSNAASTQYKLQGKMLIRALVIMCILVLAKFTYIASLSNYYTFYLMDKFQVSLQHAQLYLFAFLAAVAVGTFGGGPIGDKIGRKAVIWISFLGMLPFALMLPHANLFWTVVFAMLAGLILSSAFAAMVVYAQEAVPGRVGMVAGMMFGLMFGISGIAAAALGALADQHGIEWVFKLCSFIPLLGLATVFLPKTNGKS